MTGSSVAGRYPAVQTESTACPSRRKRSWWGKGSPMESRESAPFLGNDERLFWQRSEDRNRGTAALYDQLGLASYEAMEAFVEYIPL